MSKKDFIVHILDSLEGKRTLAKDLKKFLLLGALDTEAINGLVELFRQMASFMKNLQVKDRMLRAATLLEKMKDMELQDTMDEQQEIENLLVNL